MEISVKTIKFIAIAAIAVATQACSTGGVYKHADLADKHSSVCRSSSVFRCEILTPDQMTIPELKKE